MVGNDSMARKLSEMLHNGQDRGHLSTGRNRSKATDTFTAENQKTHWLISMHFVPKIKECERDIDEGSKWRREALSKGH